MNYNKNIFEELKKNRQKTPVEKELDRLAREEQSLKKQAVEYRAAKWKEALEQKIPPKVYANLQKAFYMAFEVIFEKGTALIEKTYVRETIEKDFQVHDFAMNLKGGKKELRHLKSEVNRGTMFNMAVSAVEGVGLGALGIGLPDIVLFLSVILKGTYETALQYGFAYDTPEERWYILKLLETAMSKGAQWIECNTAVDSCFSAKNVQVIQPVHETTLSEQIKNTADAFAVDMLLAKFIQGLPVAGILGGISNPVYYHRIMTYVQLKYRKRYLLLKL
ncbi:MAG: EcsC family protein [Lachnospiraceae bacterium]|nr:EcsC family protein [Lachnospiraceae bacterium]